MGLMLKRRLKDARPAPDLQPPQLPRPGSDRPTLPRRAPWGRAVSGRPRQPQ